MTAPGFYPRTSVMMPGPRPASFRRSQLGGRALVVVRPAEVNWMVRQLTGRGWRTATELGAKSGGQKRKLKAIVEAAAGEILHFRGSPGFKLIREATRPQILRGIATLRSEARTPLRRARCYLGYLKRRTRLVTPELFPSTNNDSNRK
jgi:hypothetical protein